MARFYKIDVQPTLFGEWAVVREWGRTGRGGTLRNKLYGTASEAESGGGVSRKRGDIRNDRLQLPASANHVLEIWQPPCIFQMHSPITEGETVIGEISHIAAASPRGRVSMRARIMPHGTAWAISSALPHPSYYHRCRR
jgi:WGR domain